VQIPEPPLESILIRFNEVTPQIIVNLFNMAMKTRQKENLCYTRTYEDQIRDIESKNKISENNWYITKSS
jgi:hypothetical protein